MAVLFKAISSNGKLQITNQIDLQKFLQEYDGKELMVEIKEYAKSGPKQKLYAFYHAVVLKSATAAFRSTGEMIDEVEIDYRLRARFAKVFVDDGKGNKIAALKDKKDMTKNELLQYIQDVIVFLDTEFNWQVPDSSEYLMEKKTGRKYTAVKSKPEEPGYTQI